MSRESGLSIKIWKCRGKLAMDAFQLREVVAVSRSVGDLLQGDNGVKPRDAKLAGAEISRECRARDSFEIERTLAFAKEVHEAGGGQRPKVVSTLEGILREAFPRGIRAGIEGVKGRDADLVVRRVFGNHEVDVFRCSHVAMGDDRETADDNERGASRDERGRDDVKLRIGWEPAARHRPESIAAASRLGRKAPFHVSATLGDRLMEAASRHLASPDSSAATPMHQDRSEVGIASACAKDRSAAGPERRRSLRRRNRA